MPKHPMCYIYIYISRQAFAVVHKRASRWKYWIGFIFCSLPFFLLVGDLESQDGSTKRPYYMSKSLLKILNKHNMQSKRH